MIFCVLHLAPWLKGKVLQGKDWSFPTVNPTSVSGLLPAQGGSFMPGSLEHLALIYLTP